MALFFRDDKSYDETRRMTRFNRYRQLMNAYALRWIVINLLTVLGVLPLAFGIWVSISSSSLVLLIPISIIGGMIFGPFLAALYDALLRGLRDAPGKWWQHYQKSWKQNSRDSLLPGAFFGLMTGIFSFMLYLIWIAQKRPSPGTILLMICSALLLLMIKNLYFTQLVLFQQTVGRRLKNAVLFTIQHFWRVIGTSFLERSFYCTLILFMPWTLILIPFIGFWFILFIVEFLLYDDLNNALQIEEQFIPFEGDPWKND